MAEFKIVSQSEYDDKHQLCTLEVTVDLGNDGVRAYTQDVILETGKVEKKAQEYADELESGLKAQQESGTLPPLEEAPAESTEEE